MTIGPGTSWSHPGLLPAGAVTIASDRALSDLAQRSRIAGQNVPIVGLTGGTLWQALGGPSVPGRLRTPDARHYAVDLVRAELDGRNVWFVGSLVAHSGGWRHAVAVMNTPWFRSLRLGHRSHPGDALLDITEATDLRVDDLRKIVPRARHGAHHPHPKLKERRVSEASWTFSPARRVVIDGHRVGRCHTLRVVVEPDALTVVV